MCMHYTAGCQRVSLAQRRSVAPGKNFYSNLSLVEPLGAADQTCACLARWASAERHQFREK